MEVIISKFNSIPSVKSTYLNGRQNIRTLSDVFQKVKNVFVQANPKPINNCVEQLSQQTFIRDARLLKYKIPLKNTNSNQVSTLLNNNESVDDNHSADLCQNLYEDNESNNDKELVNNQINTENNITHEQKTN